MKKLFSVLTGFFVAAVLLAVVPVSAHHSPAAFDLEQRVTITGVVKKATFRNPHGHLDILVTGEDGKVVEWEVETSASNLLRRRGWDFKAIKRGETVTVLGHPHKEKPAIMYIRAITLPDGTMFGDPEGEDNALD